MDPLQKLDKRLKEYAPRNFDTKWTMDSLFDAPMIEGRCEETLKSRFPRPGQLASALRRDKTPPSAREILEDLKRKAKKQGKPLSILPVQSWKRGPEQAEAALGYASEKIKDLDERLSHIRQLNLGIEIRPTVMKINYTNYSGRPLSRQRSFFAGEVEPDANYILVDDIIAIGRTSRDLARFVETGGGKVVGIWARDFAKEIFNREDKQEVCGDVFRGFLEASDFETAAPTKNLGGFQHTTTRIKENVLNDLEAFVRERVNTACPSRNIAIRYEQLTAAELRWLLQDANSIMNTTREPLNLAIRDAMKNLPEVKVPSATSLYKPEELLAWIEEQRDAHGKTAGLRQLGDPSVVRRAAALRRLGDERKS